MQTDRVGRAEQSVEVKEREPVSQLDSQSVSQSVRMIQVHTTIIRYLEGRRSTRARK